MNQRPTMFLIGLKFFYIQALTKVVDRYRLEASFWKIFNHQLVLFFNGVKRGKLAPITFWKDKESLRARSWWPINLVFCLNYSFTRRVELALEDSARCCRPHGINFTNISRAAFVPLVLRQNKYKPKM